MTELQLLIDFYKDMPRQGPGSKAETLKALSFMQLPERDLQIADIGCGTGAQTIDLAAVVPGNITAVDIFPEFLAQLQQQIKGHSYKATIDTMQGSMDALPFQPETLDIMWAEGAIYNMGFKAGIQAWYPFLKTGAYLAVSEITWLTEQRPKEIESFWLDEYPEIDRASAKIATLEANGYKPVGYFVVADTSWFNNFYSPMEAAIPGFLAKHDNSKAAQALVSSHRHEMALYQKYRQYYGYGFYIAQKL